MNGTDPADYVEEAKPLYRTRAHYPTVRQTYPEDLKTPVYEELFEKATGFLPPVLEHHEVLNKVVEASKLTSYPKADNVKPLLQNVTNTTYAYGVEFVVTALGPEEPKAVYGHFVYGTSFDKTLKLYQLYVNKVDSEYETVVNSALLKSPKPSPFTTYATRKDSHYLYTTSTAEVRTPHYGPLKYSLEIKSSLWRRSQYEDDSYYSKRRTLPTSATHFKMTLTRVPSGCPLQYPSLALNVTHKLFQTAKVLLYDKSTTEYVESPVVTEGQFLVEAVLEDLYSGVTTANVTVHTPHFEKVTFNRLPWWRALRPTVAYDMTTQAVALARKGYPFPTCMVSPYYLKTFDNVTFPLETLKKESTHVLLRHAVDEPEFYVLYEQRSEDATCNAYVNVRPTFISVLAPHEWHRRLADSAGRAEEPDLVKLTPPKDQTTYEVEVNGTLLTVDPLKSHVLQYYHNFSSQVLLYVTAHPEVAPTLWLKVRDSGLVLAYNGSSVLVTVMLPKYTGTLLGLCGDNNRESQYEYVTPEQCVVTEVEDFLNAYSFEAEKVVKGEVYCPPGVTLKVGVPVYNKTKITKSKITKISKVRGYKASKVDSDLYDDVVSRIATPECLTERRKVIYEEGKVCISLVKTTACKRGCKPTTTVKKELEFVCLNKENPTLKKMLKDIQSKRELPLSLADIPTITKSVDVPVDCIPK
ncbi:hypothetical protein HPB51_005642 [Rhipicephalus microplus]|uniref:VWFD domain-containing protein n=1 Tax=Rhipicephalus microplus TaxID=6941 RepID=A0A9J6EM82_RHIMP|nr:hypothetical protein HPB51_005642 [Rhipicephalus microplus]